MQHLLGILLSLAYVGLVLAASALLAAKTRLGDEFTRKFAHIALGGWWVIAMLFFSSPLWAALPPALFVLVNSYAYFRGGLPFIQREKGNSPGTVYYAISLLLLALFSFGPGQPYMGALGVACMALGDGFAGLAGQRLGAKAPGIAATGGKSLAGTAVMFATSFAGCLGILLIFAPRLAFIYAFVLAGTAAGVEMLSPGGLDNLTVPLGVTALYAMLHVPGAPYSPWLLGGLLSLGVVLVAWNKTLLTQPAGVGAVLVGAFLYGLGGPALWALLIWFFASANIATRLLAKAGPQNKKAHSPRRLRQVLANSVPALVCALGYGFGAGSWFLILSATALAACTADTWASEIGIYSKREPVNILTRRPMARGLSGGVSALGLFASAAGAFSTALLAMLLFYAMGRGVPTGPAAFLLVGLGGTAGSLLDSVLGACLQAKYRCPSVEGLTEAPTGSAACTLVSGISWMTNDMVNLLSGSVVVLLALPAAVF